MPSSSQKKGQAGEHIALRFLEEKGFLCIEKNWHSRYGEIDLIMQESDELVFIEVKMRKNNDFSYPEEIIGRSKTQKLKKTARQYIEAHDKQEMFWRFDIVAISGDTRKHQVHHIRDALRDD